MRALVLVGNPKSNSRTRRVAEQLTSRLVDEYEVLDLGDLGPSLLDWEDPTTGAWVAKVRTADLLIVASPTYKATYTGLLKVFLDRVPGESGLAGVTAVPLMVGASPRHAIAAELALKPLLVELGASCPAPGIFDLEGSTGVSDDLERWLQQWGDVVLRHVRATTRQLKYTERGK